MTEAQFAALAEIFAAQARTQSERLARWPAHSTSEQIAEESHRIGSASGAVGAGRAQTLAERLEASISFSNKTRVREIHLASEPGKALSIRWETASRKVPFGGWGRPQSALARGTYG